MRSSEAVYSKGFLVDKVFTLIFFNPGITPSELSAKLNLIESNISRAIGKLKEAGVIRFEYAEAAKYGINKKLFVSIGKYVNTRLLNGSMTESEIKSFDEIYSHKIVFGRLKEAHERSKEPTDIMRLITLTMFLLVGDIEKDPELTKKMELIGAVIKKKLPRSI